MTDDFRYCRSVLPKVSRTFALAIRVLPGSVGRPVLIGYLLCRIADTVEDDTSIPKEKRIEALRRFGEVFEGGPSKRDRIDGRDAGLGTLAALSRMKEKDRELNQGWILSKNASTVLNCYDELPEAQRGLVATCVRNMTSGMAHFISREASVVDPARPNGPFLGMLAHEAELEEYADCVAGNVGRFLHGVFCHHLGLTEGPEYEALKGRATPFGLGLQYTNIVQDLAADRRRGWCYVPQSMLEARGLTAEEFPDPAHREAALCVVQDLIHKAADHLESALDFTLLLPRRAPRIRLFCLWPLFLAVSTLTRALGSASVLDDKVKIGRKEVRRLVRATSLRCFREGALRRLYAKESRPLQAGIEA